VADPGSDARQLSPDYWNGLYLKGEMGWDLGEVSPPFVALHRSGRIAPPCRVVVPGCGAGWEVAWLAREGYQVTGLDFAPEALAHTRARLKASGVTADLVRADMLAPPKELWGRFDVLLEQTCFCAVDPSRRDDYVTGAWRLLAPGGRLLGLFYASGVADGPPFHTDPDEVPRRFGNYFDVRSMQLTPHSHERRRGREWLGELVRRP